ncbi:MAG TPA: 2-succinyl-6-hydroxy-2,4-cyclohexadiene-1-carboxylate synthase [Gemmatirosa sp.]
MPEPADVAQDVDVGDGLRLHVARAGTGPALLLLHGFTGAGTTWAPLVAALGGRYTTLAVDLPGHGRSGAPADPARYALARLADDLTRVLDACDVTRVAVLGYSLGGRAALRFALAHPGRVDALLLESASPGIADPAERAARVAADRALADTIERDGVAAFVDRWERLPLWASQASLGEDVRVRLRVHRLANDARGLANSLRGAGAGADPPVLDQLGAIGAPTLIVAGALDAKYVALGRAMREVIAGARLVVMPGAGHAVHLERPAEFAGVVRECLGEPRGAEGGREEGGVERAGERRR